MYVHAYTRVRTRELHVRQYVRTEVRTPCTVHVYVLARIVAEIHAPDLVEGMDEGGGSYFITSVWVPATPITKLAT